MSDVDGFILRIGVLEKRVDELGAALREIKRGTELPDHVAKDMTSDMAVTIRMVHRIARAALGIRSDHTG